MSKNAIFSSKSQNNKTFIQIITRLGIILLIMVLLLGTAGIILKDHLLFHTHLLYEGQPSQFSADYETVWLNTLSGEKLKAWYIPAPNKNTTKTLFVLQGNSGNMSLMLDRLAIFHSLDVNIMIVDYPGYGESSGSPTEEGTYEAAEAMWQWATKNKNPQDIIIYGFSLGGGVASWLAEQHPPQALILDSTFTKLRAVPDFLMPPLKPYFYLAVGDAYDTQARLKNINCPLLILHSPDDQVVPYTLGQELYNTYQGNKKNIATGIGRHMDFARSYYSNNPNGYQQHLKNLLQP